MFSSAGAVSLKWLRFHRARLAVLHVADLGLIRHSFEGLKKKKKMKSHSGKHSRQKKGESLSGDLMECGVSTIQAFRAEVIKPSRFHGK